MDTYDKRGLCRFISPNRIEYLDPQSINGLNLYCYCMNNPIMYSYPSGYLPEWAAWLIGGAAIVGGIVLCATGVGGNLGGLFGFRCYCFVCWKFSWKFSWNSLH